MSAPNPGRQSPDPARQSEAQSGQTTDNVNKQGGGPQQGAEKASDQAKDHALSSNPEHPLKQHAEETTSKKV
ncbi:hypothetical protein BDW02DRAFT_558216 [Decorospora gaudefroyi]|uniref:Uncharacterized protein n=1 Tax=Decorospora gaudefroyi TaxID=184978 RepID=A0A6A5JZT5_9PLEO|nr:hypothetical protein BDW02DRAFT_558216 [Decorospora gaudefroyi]